MTGLAEPVFAEAGDVVIFTEGVTHNAYPVLDDSRRRSLFFNWVPSIGAISVDFAPPSPQFWLNLLNFCPLFA